MAINKNTYIKNILFLINPILGIISTLKSLNTKSSQLIIYLFIILFGICFTVPSGRTKEFSNDGTVYRYRFDRAVAQSNLEFNDAFKRYLEFEEGEKDIYVTLLSFLTSRFTNNYHWIFTIYAIVFGFFFLRSFRFITDSKYYDNGLTCLIIAGIFVMSNSMFNINGVRFWTAAWVAVAATFQIFVNRDLKYFVLALVTPLIHVSYLLYVIIIIIAFFTGKYKRLWVPLFALSFLLSSFARDLLIFVETLLPPFMSKTVTIYTDEELMELKESSLSWYQQLFSFLEVFIVNIIVVIFLWYQDEIKKNKKSYFVFLFLIVWMTFVNFTISVPSLGSRFLHISLPFICFIWLYNFKQYRKFISILFLIIIAFSMDFLYQTRMIFKVTEPEFFLASPIYNLIQKLFA